MHSNLVFFVGLEHHFVSIVGSWGNTTLVIHGCKGALKGALQRPNIDVHRFLMIFRCPVETTLESLFPIIRRMKKHVWIAGTRLGGL